MYKELGKFGWHMARQCALWKDGELWTAVVGGLAGGYWLSHDQVSRAAVRGHIAEILSVTSIVFGFVSTALVFYIGAAGNWSNDQRVRNVAAKLIDWHVWTIVSLLAFMGYTVLLWAFAKKLDPCSRWQGPAYGVFTFLGLYCGGQILNHALTVHWTFRRSNDLNK